MAASLRSQALSLYKMLLRESGKFPSYNYRFVPINTQKGKYLKHFDKFGILTYALRRVRDAFKENRSVQDPGRAHSLLQEGLRSLHIVQRQVAVGQMFTTQRLVLE